MATHPFLQRCLQIGSYPVLPSPRVGRYLALVSGAIILAVTCRVWFALQVITTNCGIWSGPFDPDLVQCRSCTAWLWQHDPFGIVLMIWGLVGLAALGPFTTAAWRERSWPTTTWGTGTLILCCTYFLLGCTLMLMPLGRFG